MKDFEISVLTANSGYLQTAALNYVIACCYILGAIQLALIVIKKSKKSKIKKSIIVFGESANQAAVLREKVVRDCSFNALSTTAPRISHLQQ